MSLSDNAVASPQRLVDEEPSTSSDGALGPGANFDAAGERLLDAVLDLDLDSPLPTPIANLTAASPYFQNGLVKVDVSWNKPDDNGATDQASLGMKRRRRRRRRRRMRIKMVLMTVADNAEHFLSNRL